MPKGEGQAMPLSEEGVIRRKETATAKPKGRSELGKVNNNGALKETCLGMPGGSVG